MKSLFQTFAFVLEKKRYSLGFRLKLFFTHLALRGKARFLSSDTQAKHTILGFKVVGDSYELLSFLFYEVFIIEEYYFESPKNNPVIYDCGSNIGFSILYFKWLYPNATIHAFEPQPIAFEFLQKNVKNNQLENVLLHNIALSDKEGTIEFFQPNGTVSLMASTLKERFNSDTVLVRCEPLSKYITDSVIDVLKIDVEGAEKDIISDLDNSRKMNCFERIIIEYHHKIGAEKSALAAFLNRLEKNNLEYQILSNYHSIRSFQDIIIDCYRPS